VMYLVHWKEIRLVLSLVKRMAKQMVYWTAIHLDPLKEIHLDRNLVHHSVYWTEKQKAKYWGYSTDYCLAQNWVYWKDSTTVHRSVHH